MGIETVHKNEIRQVVCLVTWRTKGRLSSDPAGEPQVERMQLGVEVSEEEPDAPYASRYYAPWPEAKRMIEARHNTHQNFYEILSIEPECSCLGPCRYPDRTRFRVVDLDDTVGYFATALTDSDTEFKRIAAGSKQDMELLLERHRRSNHHQ